MKEKDENEIVEKNEEQKINIEKDNNNDDIDDDDIKDDVKLIKVSSSELIINI